MQHSEQYDACETCHLFGNHQHGVIFVLADISYLKTVLPGIDERFFDYLKAVSAKDLKVYFIDEGLVVFPKVPLITVEGPLPIAQLLETTLLNLVNYARYITLLALRCYK